MPPLHFLFLFLFLFLAPMPASSIPLPSLSNAKDAVLAQVRNLHNYLLGSSVSHEHNPTTRPLMPRQSFRRPREWSFTVKNYDLSPLTVVCPGVPLSERSEWYPESVEPVYPPSTTATQMPQPLQRRPPGLTAAAARFAIIRDVLPLHSIIPEPIAYWHVDTETQIILHPKRRIKSRDQLDCQIWFRKEHKSMTVAPLAFRPFMGPEESPSWTIGTSGLFYGKGNTQVMIAAWPLPVMFFNASGDYVHGG